MKMNCVFFVKFIPFNRLLRNVLMSNKLIPLTENKRKIYNKSTTRSDDGEEEVKENAASEEKSEA